MINSSKVYVCTVFHHSDLRPRGLEMANQFIDSWKNSKLEYNLIVLDNESTTTFDKLSEIPHTFIRVDSQNENGGITGAWNQLIKFSIEKGAKIVTGFADDVKINPSLKSLIDATADEDTVYVPLTDGMLSNWPDQKSNTVKPNYIKEVKLINGFWMSFTDKFYYKRNIDGDLFDLTNPRIGKWSTQENMFEVWNNSNATKALVVGDCWLHHTKLRSWREARTKFDN